MKLLHYIAAPVLLNGTVMLNNFRYFVENGFSGN